MVTLEMWQEWLESPVTRALREWAQREQDDLKGQWASGAFTDVFQGAMAVRNAAATGACSVYGQIEELDYSLMIEGEADGSDNVGPQPSDNE